MQFRRWLVSTTVVGVAAMVTLIVARPFQPPTIVDGFVIGPDRTCTDIGLAEPRCDGLVARAIALNPVDSSAVVGHSLHDVGQVETDGQLGLAAWGAGTPFGLVLIDYSDGTQHATTIGCFGVRSPQAPTDPLCPDASAGASPSDP